MSESQSLSKISLLSERFDIIQFVEKACGPAVSMTSFPGLFDLELASKKASLVILDVSLFLSDDFAKLQRIEVFSERIVLIIPADLPSAVVSYAEKSFKFFIPYPVSMEVFRASMVRFCNYMNHKDPEDIQLLARNEAVPKSFFGYFCGTSDKILDVRRKLLKVSCSKRPVLLLGETGTGKNTAARVIHALSENKGKKLVRLPLSTVVDTLAGSVFFGHAKGAFTSAECDSKGVFERASETTLFLDELGSASLDVQKMLLSVLDTGYFKKVGSEIEQHTNARLILATNADIYRMMKGGTFRDDLFYRICDNIISIPPIRERKEDIHYMVDVYIQKKNFTITKSALEKLENYSWPGNIRELHKCLGDAMENNPSHVITEKDLALAFLDY